nr:gypsy/Ty3 retroelement polyprotein [Tanacetum cinerariifolium]
MIGLIRVLGLAAIVVVAIFAWRFLNWVWLKPKKMEKFLRDQGLKGTSYKFLYGDVKDMVKMITEAYKKPINLDDDIVPRVLSFAHSIFATRELNRLNGEEGTSNRGGIGSQYGRLTKFEFPKFYGEDVQGWLYRVNQFFLLDSIADEQKVIPKTFDSVFEDPMVELKILKHVTTVQLYQEQFEAMMNKVELSEAYAVTLFIGGLKDEISMHVRMFKPNTLSDVYCLAKMQEATLQASKTRQTPLLTTPRTPYATTSYANKTVKQLRQKEIANKRAKNLCFYCDEKFVPGQKCSGQLFLLEICVNKSTSEEYELEALLDEPVVQNFGESITDTPVISLHAMTGGSTYKTMRVKAYVGKHTVHSLIDSGSIHIFLDLKVAKKLGCKPKATCVTPLFVKKTLCHNLGVSSKHS